MNFMRLLIYASIAIVLMPHAADAWMWALPTKVDGVFYLDHFGGCYCYNDVGLMYVSEKEKSFVTPYANKPVTLDVTRTYQQSFPGTIRLEQFTISTRVGSTGSQTNDIRLDASWLLGKKRDSLNLSITNSGASAVSIYPSIIDFMVLTKKSRTSRMPAFMEIADGPSIILGAQRISGWSQRNWSGSFVRDDQVVSWTVRDGRDIQDTVLLQPHKSTNIVIDLQ